MIRTKDLFLFLVTIVFLLVAIGSTVFMQSRDKGQVGTTSLGLADPTQGEFEVDVVEGTTSVSRAERLASMRQKIAADADLFIAKSTVDARVEEVQSEEGSGSTEETDGLADTECGPAVPYQVEWEPANILTKTTEGVRVYYTEQEIAVEVASTSGSTTTMVQMTTRQEIPRLQLPLRPVLSENSHCARYDLVAVASDGSLIKNNEYDVYSIFSEQTLIGYALDGWPIYGTTNKELDECGGRLDGQSYAYYLEGPAGRERIIECFVSDPLLIN
jgi:hypothetical protein